MIKIMCKKMMFVVSSGDHIVTERLYPILIMSGLPKETLGRLWNLANTHTPGQLSRSELWILLAFVALVQVTVHPSVCLSVCPFMHLFFP
jgi:hypothetical protein